MLPFLRKKSAGKGILVLKTDGFGLRATVVNGSADALKVTVSVSSQQVDPAKALQDVLEQLKNVLGKHIPSNTLLLHISAIPDLVQLTESLDSPDAANLLEMLRWEMEGVVAMQSPSWDLGWLLLGRGYISAEQREQLVELVTEEKQLSAQGGRSPMRLGEVAIREGMVSKEQIGECLRIQQKLQLADQRLLTQWRPQPSQQVEDEFGGEEMDAGHAYLCSAMPAAQHQQWLDAIKKVSGVSGIPKLYLRQVYPFAGSSLPLVLQSSETVLITEFHKAYVFCALVREGQLLDVSMLKCSSHRLDTTVMAEMLGAGQYIQAGRWLTLDVENAFAEQIDQLGALLALQPEALNRASDLDLPSGKLESAPELGVARHFLGSAPLSISPLIGMPPPDPIYRSKGFKIALASLLLPLTIAGYEGYYYWQIQQLKAELVSKEQQLADMKDAKKKQRRDFSEAKTNISTFKDMQNELSSLQSEKQLVEQIIVKRQAFMERLLPVLSESINDGVVLDSLTENQWYQFRISGRAIDQASIDDFNQILAISLESLDMYIASSPSNFAGDSAMMQNGIYAFEFLLKPKESS